MGRNTNALARRSGRIYAESGELMEVVIPITSNTGTKSGSDTEDSLTEKAPKPITIQPSKLPTNEGTEGRIAPVVNLGRDLCSIFPSTKEDVGNNGKLNLPTLIVVQSSAHYATSNSDQEPPGCPCIRQES